MKILFGVIGLIAGGLIVGVGLYIYSNNNLGAGTVNTFGDSRVTNASTTLASFATTSIFSANTGRLYASICNTSTTAPVYISLGDENQMTGIAAWGVTIGSERCYDINSENTFLGNVTGWTTLGTTTITAVEHLQ